jgi:hypothetical protein
MWRSAIAPCGRLGLPHSHRHPSSTLFLGYAGDVARTWQARIPRAIWFSDEHEAEAKDAQLSKPPSRFGTWMLRRLGFRGRIGESPRQMQTRHLHERPIQRRLED